MATKINKLATFKRGDTPVFAYTFSNPGTGFSWSGITVDFAVTAVAAPADNSGAAMSRLGRTLTVNADNSASIEFQITPSESRALTPGVTYKVECQLHDGSNTNVATAITQEVTVDQDYVI